MKLITTTIVATCFAAAAHGNVVFEQDFSSSTTVADFYSVAEGGNATASGGIFQFIGNDDLPGPTAGTGFTESIVGGQLVHTVDSSPSGATGFTSNAFVGDPLEVATFDFKIQLDRTNDDFDFGPAAAFIIGSAGNTDTPVDEGTSSAGSFLQWTIRATGGDWQIENDGSGTTETVADLPYGTQISIQIVLNNTGAAINFPGIDGNNHTLADRQYSMFYDAGSGWVEGLDDIGGRAFETGNGDPDIEGFKFELPKGNTNATFDDFKIQDAAPVPEPTSALAILGLGGMLLARRRRL